MGQADFHGLSTLAASELVASRRGENSCHFFDRRGFWMFGLRRIALSMRSPQVLSKRTQAEGQPAPFQQQVVSDVLARLSGSA